MAALAYDCPHCKYEKITFTLEHFSPPKKTTNWQLFFSCNNCGEFIMAKSRYNPDELTRVSDVAAVLFDIHPNKPLIEIPEHLPDDVAEAFREGVYSRSPRLAGISFRRCLELALKDLSPDIEAWKVEKRIDQMFEKGLITQALKDWAHKIRVDGNEFVHGDGDITKAMSDELCELTRYILIYLYTLPTKVKLARGLPE